MIVFFENSKNMGWSTDNILTIINIFVLLLTLYFTYRSSDKKIKADLVSKARIDWIQNVRKSASEFISACFMFDKTHQSSAEKRTSIPKQTYSNVFLPERQGIYITCYWI